MCITTNIYAKARNIEHIEPLHARHSPQHLAHDLLFQSYYIMESKEWLQSQRIHQRLRGNLLTKP